MPCSIFRCEDFLPKNCCDEIRRAEYLIHHITERLNFVVVEADENCSILAEKLPEQCQSRIHHAKPSAVTVERLPFFPDDFSQPLANPRIVDVVVGKSRRQRR